MAKKTSLLFGFLLIVLFVPVGLHAQNRITTPKEQFGFNIGDDYVLVNYSQYEAYLKKLGRAEGKSIVWIDGGLHATEVLGAQQLIELQYQLVSRNDPETIRFLNDDIVINCLVNP